MTHHIPTADDFDRQRDLRKVDRDPVPGTPLFEQKPSAYTIAALCCGIPIEEAASLIERFADMRASEAKVEEAQHIYERLDSKLRENRELV